MAPHLKCLQQNPNISMLYAPLIPNETCWQEAAEEDADAAGVEALAEAIIAAVPGETVEAGAAQTAGDGAARRGGKEDADHEHERLWVRDTTLVLSESLAFAEFFNSLQLPSIESPLEKLAMVETTLRT